MNKTDLINTVAASTGITKKDTEAVLSSALDIICASLTAGEPVKLSGFGTFEIQRRAARIARNPKENTPVTVAPTDSIRFRPGKALKEAVSACGQITED